jgi:hypothetical protein
VDVEARRILELEETFRREGLPNLIVGRSLAEDLRSVVPILGLVFVVEVAFALDLPSSRQTAAAVLVGALVVTTTVGVSNVLRRRRVVSLPERVGAWESLIFVLVPALVTGVTGDGPAAALVLALVNAGLLLLAYLVVVFGVLAVVRWTVVRLFAQLAASRTVLVRAVPLLLFFSLVMFFTTEIWQVFTTTGSGLYWTAIGLFGALGLLFLAVSLPGIVRQTESDLDLGNVPLRRRELLNLEAVALMSEVLQVLFVSAAVWLFYVVLGTLLVSAEVRGAWLGRADHVVWELAWLGERAQVTSELLRVATGVAAFSGLYYAVAILVDPSYRDQFVDSFGTEMRSTFERRAEYHRLLEHHPAGTGELDA